LFLSGSVIFCHVRVDCLVFPCAIFLLVLVLVLGSVILGSLSIRSPAPGLSQFIEGYDGSSNNNGYRNNNNIFSNNKDSIAITSTTVATTPGAFIVITGSSDGKFRLFNGGEMCKPIGDGRGIQPPMVEVSVVFFFVLFFSPKNQKNKNPNPPPPPPPLL